MEPDTVFTDEPTDVRVQQFLPLAQQAKTAEELAKVLILAGWGSQHGDPPIETWPAFRAIVPLLRVVLP